MLDGAQLVAFVPTSDLERARRFYGEALALPMVERTAFACVFGAPNATLRVTAVEHPARAPYTVLGWQVPDILAAVGELEARGVPLLRYDGIAQDELGIWTSPTGARVAWFEDPDGNLLSVTQL
jgi:catechol 2,3-dioxygenase-like lactoylglutathione lyase family enzyme